MSPATRGATSKWPHLRRTTTFTPTSAPRRPARVWGDWRHLLAMYAPGCDHSDCRDLWRAVVPPSLHLFSSPRALPARGRGRTVRGQPVQLLRRGRYTRTGDDGWEQLLECLPRADTGLLDISTEKIHRTTIQGSVEIKLTILRDAGRPTSCLKVV